MLTADAEFPACSTFPTHVFALRVGKDHRAVSAGSARNPSHPTAMEEMRRMGAARRDAAFQTNIRSNRWNLSKEEHKTNTYPVGTPPQLLVPHPLSHSYQP